MTLRHGSFKLFVVKAQGEAGLVSGVHLSITGLPDGVTAKILSAGSAITMIRLDADSAAGPSTATATITGTLGSATQQISLDVTVK